VLQEEVKPRDFHSLEFFGFVYEKTYDCMKIDIVCCMGDK